MGRSRIPDLIDALVARLPALMPAGVSVYDGSGVTANPGDFVMVGIGDPTGAGVGTSATASQTVGPFSTQRKRDETGSLWIVAYSSNGDGSDAGQKVARDLAFSYMGAVEDLLRSDPNLGIASGGDFVAQMGDSIDYDQNQTPNGADAVLIFNVAYFARI